MAARIVVACPNLSLDRTMAVATVAIGRVHRSERLDVRGGGKGVNVARALTAVGASAAVLGFAAGHTGRAVMALLADEGIEARAVSYAGENRSCLTVVSGRDTTVFNESGPPLPAEAWTEYEELVASALNHDTVFVCSGSFPPGAPDDGAARLVRDARRSGCTTICDTSRAQLARVLAERPDLVAPNLAEARAVLEEAHEELLDPGPDALTHGRRVAGELVARGAGAAIVSLGSAGAVSHSRAGTRTWEPHVVDVVNPVGAGDCLVAGIAWGLASRLSLEESIRRGMALAAASCETFAAGVVERARYEELVRSSA